MGMKYGNYHNTPTITSYSLYPGIDFIYDDIDSSNCLCNVTNDKNIIEIDYCLKGKAEFTMKNGICLYVSEGDLFFTRLSNHADNISFPTSEYHGCSFIINMPVLEKHMDKVLPDTNLNIHDVLDKFFTNDSFYLLQEKEWVKNIFSEIYSIPEELKIPYFRTKIRELLIYLSILNPCYEKRKKFYYQKNVDVIKEIRKHLIDKRDYRHTISELANEFGISQTTLKTYFKKIYGVSISVFMKRYRLQYATRLLKETNLSILEISEEIGYKNQSKFAGAFKELNGLTPLEYRHKYIKH